MDSHSFVFSILNAGDYLSFDVYSQSNRWVDPTCCFAEILSSQLLLLSGQYSSLLKINYSNSSGSELILNSKIAAYLGMADFNKAKSLLDIDTNTDSMERLRLRAHLCDKQLDYASGFVSSTAVLRVPFSLPLG